VLAIAGLNVSASDSDFLVRPQLVATRPLVTPGQLVINEVAGAQGGREALAGDRSRRGAPAPAAETTRTAWI